tara:strand:- start:12 stop:257 length:246 start_codon:yes stop_codon:yes gene_type:complete
MLGIAFREGTVPTSLVILKSLGKLVETDIALGKLEDTLKALGKLVETDIALGRDELTETAEGRPIDIPIPSEKSLIASKVV